MNTRLILPFILLVVASDLNGQVLRRFSTDFTKYPDELALFMGQSVSEDEAVALTEYSDEWASGAIPDSIKSYIIAVSNFMLGKNARPKPHYMLFLNTLNKLDSIFPDTVSYMNWKKAFYDLAGKTDTRLTQIENFLEFSFDLFSGRYIHKSSAMAWIDEEGSFIITYEDSLRIRFKADVLTCKVVRDSFNIYRTTGIYNPMSGIWKGTGGTVTWERSEYDTATVHAELGRYEINMNLSYFTADSVNFYNKNYFDYPLLGKIEEHAESVKTPGQMNYPKFESYQSDYKIKELYKNIDFRGGLSMYGSTLVGSGTRNNKARLSFYRNDSLKLLASSTYFGMEAGKITSPDVAIKIPIGTDSIVHPDIGMTYFVERNELSLYRNQLFQSQSPYYNNYHNLEMNFEQLSWKLDENKILFKMREAAAMGMANFQSENLFDAQLYMRLQGIDQENPLVILRRFSEKVFSISFKGVDYAKYIRAQHYQVQQTLKQLAVLGFLVYDVNEDLVTLRQKLYDWVYASVNYIDYDVINFVSETAAPLENASLDLSTYDLTIKGIPRIMLSNVQNVTIYPTDATIIMKQNRSFQFDGVISAGLFRFFGKDFFFDYDEFKLDLQDIDSLHLKMESDQMDASGRLTLLDIESIIQNMTGELLIDKSDNKSGRKDYPRYPVFTSQENSFVFYDDPSIQKGVYHRDKLYFEIYPFTFDSLDNFNSMGLKLDGRFISGGIFPEMEQTLIVQDDRSLGFKGKTDAAGLPLYTGKGQYYDLFEMSNKGLKGTGRFNYLASTGRSDDITFHPDSMFCKARDFTINQQVAGIQYPTVSSKGNDVLWYPYLDSMNVAEGEKPFKILNDSTSFSGHLALEPTGLSGSGTMELTNSVLISDKFTYQAFAFDADTADLRLKSVNTTGFTLITDNVNAHVDFKGRSGLFKTNEDFSLVQFPENKYTSQLDLFQWNMDRNELIMGSQPSAKKQPRYMPVSELEEGLTGPRYISTDPYQDSLEFVSPSAVYDYKKNVIRASMVKYLKVADAFIFPENGKLVIEPDGTMGQLDSALILVNCDNKLHNIYDATVSVIGRYKYKGSGSYDYVDETDNKQLIKFDKIDVDKSVQTVATGVIPEEKRFMLSPYYGFTGEVTLYAGNPFLTFNGGARLVHGCDKIELNYLKFEAEINPDSILIPVPPQPLNNEMNYIYSGLFITRDSSHIYPAFFSRKKLASDISIVTASGYLYYDKGTEEYRIAEKDKLSNLELPGNYLVLPRKNCEEYGEGKMDLGIRLGQARLSSVGNIVHKMDKTESDLNVMISMDFFASDAAMAIMGTDLDSLQNLEAVDMSDPFYNKGLAVILGSEEADRMKQELQLYGEYKQVPGALIHTLFLSDVDLFWNQNTRSYRSRGKIGIGSIGGNQVHKKVNGYMELSKRRSGDLFDLYLELDEKTWYYLGYTRGVMHMLSSNRDFNMTINNLKTSQRQLKTAKDEMPYVFIVTTPDKKNAFLKQFMQEEAGEEEQQ